MKLVYWNPYLVGTGIGILSWVVFVVVNAPLGISTAVAELSGVAAMPIIGKEAVMQSPYWMKVIPACDYGTLFLAGTFLGALASALLSKSFRLETVPETWRAQFGSTTAKRFAAAFLGGILTMFGARLAGGCTSGHGLSGTLQLALSSWIFFPTMFITGIITAAIMFKTANTAEEK